MHPPGARFVIERDEDRTIVRVIGEIDLATIDDFDAALADASKGEGPVLVDLHECRYIDSKGLFTLTHWKAQLDARMSVDIPPEGPIRRIFEISGLASRLGSKTP